MYFLPNFTASSLIPLTTLYISWFSIKAKRKREKKVIFKVVRVISLPFPAWLWVLGDYISQPPLPTGFRVWHWRETGGQEEGRRTHSCPSSSPLPPSTFREPLQQGLSPLRFHLLLLSPSFSGLTSHWTVLTPRLCFCPFIPLALGMEVAFH